ncbi:MAG: hypothetical protein QF673_00040 [Candidatus Hydrothermarchaeota archaeon]|nr:hypothetical protein [Candidatus Hydrothermarchaeota archaeon]
MKFKATDLVKLLVSNKQEEIQAKYRLSMAHVAALKKALEKGKWKVC